VQTLHSLQQTDNTISSFIGFWECRGSDVLELILSIPKAWCSLRLLAISRLPSRRSPPCLRRHLRALTAISQLLWTDELYKSYVTVEDHSSNNTCSSGGVSFEQYNFEFSCFNDDFSFLYGGITADFPIEHNLFSCHVTPQLSLTNSGDSTGDVLATVDTLTTGGILATRHPVPTEHVPIRANSPSSQADSALSSSGIKNLPTIHCSWPSCMESFSSRRDYKSALNPFSEIVTN
jgi:hypothetical protein